MRDMAIETLRDAGHEVTVSDLCAERFNATAGPEDFTARANSQRFDLGVEQMNAARNSLFAADLRREIDRLMAADLLILQFPLWWYSMPAVLKGWIDRVFAFGVAYDFGRTWDHGAMRGKRAMLSFTTSAPKPTFLPDGKNGDMERILWPIHAGIFGVCGYDVLKPFIAHSVAFIDEASRQSILSDYRRRLLSLESEVPLFFHPLADYGPERRLKPEVMPRTPGQHRGQRFHLDESVEKNN
jgi:NAD(P)H dehydrogenase (quinone)